LKDVKVLNTRRNETGFKKDTAAKVILHLDYERGFLQRVTFTVNQKNKDGTRSFVAYFETDIGTILHIFELAIAYIGLYNCASILTTFQKYILNI